MKTALLAAAALLSSLTGCVVAPVPEPVVVAPPPPVIVRPAYRPYSYGPAYRPYYYGPRPHYWRHWR